MTTEKDNYLSLLAGDVPEWITNQTIGPMPLLKHPSPLCLCEPPLVSEFRMQGGGKDIWGVEYVSSESAGGALTPSTEYHILEDIEEWRDVIVAPDISNIDWEAMAKEHLDSLPIDRNQTGIAFNTHFGYFQNLIAFMGFTEGVIAMYENPEEVKSLFEYMCDFYCEVTDKIMRYYKPDVYMMFDDTAAWQAPFISPEMYHDICVPSYDRQAAFGREADIPIIMHNCGMSGCFIDDWLSIGVREWDSAQTCNDLDQIKLEYGDRLVIAGGWDARESLANPNVSDKEIYDSIDETFHRLGKGGGFAFVGMILGDLEDPECARLNTVLFDAVDEIGHKIYS